MLLGIITASDMYGAASVVLGNVFALLYVLDLLMVPIGFPLYLWYLFATCPYEPEKCEYSSIITNDMLKV